jgi:threonine synthase
MWKAFDELAAIAWLTSDKRPRMVAVQSEGCCPIVTAYKKGERFAELHQHAATIASGLRVPAAVGDFMILDAVRESGGCAVAVEEARIRDWLRAAMSHEGIAVCPEAAACVGAVEKLVGSGWIKPNERVVIFNTGAAQKYVEAIAAKPQSIDLQQPIDWDAIEAA